MSHPLDRQLIGWLFSVYPDRQDGAVIWLIAEDGTRHRLAYPFPTVFYLAGRDFSRLHDVYTFLMGRKQPPEMVYVFKRDLFKGLRMVL